MANEDDLKLRKEIEKEYSNAFDFKFSKYFDYLYNYGFSLTSDEALIKDAIQDVFM